MRAKAQSLPLLFFLLVLEGCHSRRTQPDQNLASLDLLRGNITMCGNQELGEVSFSLSCDADTRDTFNLAVSLLHSFEYEEAEKAFVKVLDKDPDCAMAYWGIAMSNFHSLWLQTGTEYLEKGSSVLRVAETLPTSEREKDYLNAIGIFYNDWENTDHATRIQRFEKRMEQVYEKYKSDPEAAIFYALALTASADPADKTYKNQRKSGKILEGLFPDQPNHPGIAHYIIHNYDYPELAALALPTARRYAQIAPASAHAQHMPSHIFTRLGLWDEAIQSNVQSTAAALCYSERIDPQGHWDEELHGMDYLVYAYLQKGDNQKAREQYDYLRSFKRIFPMSFKVAYTAAAIPARIALENRNWAEAAQFQLPALGLDWKSFPWQSAIFHFTRGMGAIRSGDKKSAEKELTILNALHQELVDAKDAYKANQVQIQINTMRAWIHYANGKSAEALALMQEAARMEYNTAKHPVTPGEVLPAGELLADLYLEMNRPAQALEAYASDLQQHPNRFNGLYGAARAARALGDKPQAARYYTALLAQTRSTNAVRPEVVEARTFVGNSSRM